MNKKDKVWLNIFIRDMLLSVVLLGLQSMTHFRSYTVFFISGMLAVWITWHLSDYFNYLKLKKFSEGEWHG